MIPAFILLALLVGLVVALFGLGRLPAVARDAGWLYGKLQKLKQDYPWLARIPWLSRFFR